MKKILYAVILTLLALEGQVGAENGNAGTDAFLFMWMSYDARGMAMGSARAAGVEGVTGLLWNPAGLAVNRKHELFFTNSQLLNRQSANLGAYSGSHFGPGNVGLSVAYIDLGTIDITRVNLLTGGSVTGLGSSKSWSMMGTLGYGLRLHDNLHIGVNLKIAHEKLVDVSATGVAFDLGVKYMIYDWTFGLSVQNIGPQIKFISRKDNLPLLVRTGIHKKWFGGKFRTEIDLQKPTSNNLGVNIGGEYQPIEYFSLRAGWDSLIDAGSGLSAGIGAYYRGIEASYAFVDSRKLEHQHRVSLAYRWGGETNRSSKPEKNPRQSRHITKSKKVEKVREIQKTTPSIRVSKRISTYDYNKGEEACLKKDYEKAIMYLTRGRPSEEQKLEYHTLLGISYFGSDDFVKARYHLEEALKINPKDRNLKSLLGMIE